MGLALTGVGVGLIVIAAALATALLFRSASATDWLEHSYIVRNAVGKLVTAIDGVEIAARDRMLTHSPQSDAAYRANRAEIDSDLAALQALVADNPRQVDRLGHLRRLTQARLAALDAYFASGALAQPPTSLDPEGGFAAIHALIDRFDQAERLLQVGRQRTVDRLEAVLIGLVIFCLVCAAGVSVSVSRTHWSYQRDLRAQTAALMAESENRKRAEGQLLQAQKLETIGQLTAGIAHDFNNLLTIVIGNLDNARARLGEESGRAARSIDLAAEGAQRAAGLTQRLLAFSRQQPLAPRQLDLNKIVAGISEVLTRTVGETIRIETVLAGGLWPAFADSNQVENAIVNLVVNGRDAMPEGGKITIETANAHLDESYVAQFGDVAAGQYAMLSVSDTGCGIPRETLPRVFDPFFTTKEVGKGTGLGLAMIHGFVKQSKGHIRIYSEIGHGTTVKIYLPRMSEAAEPAAAPPISAPEGAPPLAAAGEAVLMVEDDEGVREFALGALKSLGYRVFACRDAAEALAVIGNGERVDLLFTDVVLPGGVNGRRLAEQARALRPSLPVLYTTGYTRNAIVHDGRLDADVRLLSKPYSGDMLARAARSLIDEARAEA